MNSAEVWNDSLLKDPHTVADKRSRVRRMFAAIAPSYDLNNRVHSFWMDQYWRRKAARLSGLVPGDVVVDVACGTGDLSLCYLKALSRLDGADGRGGPRVIGVDFTFEMLPRARAKSRAAGAPSFIQYVSGDAMCLPLPDACCDLVSIAFGIRNIADPAAALAEFRRILRPGGRVVILEFSLPSNRLLRALYNFYFRQVLPRTATLISGDKTGAYKYLPESVNTFISRQRMADLMVSAGFSRVEEHPLTFGVCVCYRGKVAND